MRDNSEGQSRGSAARYAAVAASLLALGALAVIWRWLRREDDARPEPETPWDDPATTPAAPASIPAGREPVASPEAKPGPEPEPGPGPGVATAGQQPAGPYGPDSAEPLPDGSAPDGFTVKGNADSMLYHAPESPYYKRTKPEVWFRSIEAAEAAGFSHWHSRRKRD